MPEVAIYCKASVPEGMGHVYRQLNLANELRKQGWLISFHIPHFAPAIALLTQHNYVPTLVEPNILISEYFNKRYDIAILDIQDTTDILIFSIKKKISKVISFEDLGSGRVHVNLLVDCNIDPSESKNFTSNTITFFGKDYSVLHPDFTSFNKKPRRFNTYVQSALISMGSTDPKDLTIPITQLLVKRMNDLQLTILTGHKAINMPQLEKIKSQNNSLVLSGPISNMAKTLWEHEVVICSGGITLDEAAAVGTPAFVVGQAEHQKSKINFIENSGAAINLGQGENFKKELLLEALSLGKHKLESMSLKGKKLIDGHGISRVINGITAMIKSKN